MENLKRYIQHLTQFSEESWDILCDSLTERKFVKGEKLLQSGEVCNSIFFISHGYCKSCCNQDGKEVNTAFYFENDFATNTRSLIGRTKSDFEIVACENLTVLEINRMALINAYRKSHEIEAFGRKLLEAVVLKQEEHADSFKLMTPQQRYQHLVINQPAFLQRVSLTQIASYLGISRETLSRIRSR